MSSAIARNIFRMFSACCCSWVWVLNFDSFVTPSTRWATSDPKRSSMSPIEYSVSSGTSWSSAAVIATGSRPSSARICAEAMGWVTYGSPEARFCSRWASTARSKAPLTGPRTACGWWARIASRSGCRSVSTSMVAGVATAARAGPRPLVEWSAPVRRGPRLGWVPGVAALPALPAVAELAARAVPAVAETPAAEAAAAAAAAGRVLEVAIPRSVALALPRSGRHAGRPLPGAASAEERGHVDVALEHQPVAGDADRSKVHERRLGLEDHEVRRDRVRQRQAQRAASRRPAACRSPGSRGP